MKERIKAVRIKVGKNQTDFAQSISVSRSAICKMESGENSPSEQTIKIICKEYDVNEEWLRTGEGEMFIQKSKEEQLGEMLAEITKADDESFKKRLIVALANLDENGWDSDIMKSRKAVSVSTISATPLGP